jgi:hypothetical protein
MSEGFEVWFTALRGGVLLTVSFTPHASAGVAFIVIAVLKKRLASVNFITYPQRSLRSARFPKPKHTLATR